MRIQEACAGNETMTTNRETSQNYPITTSLENLSKGVDRILRRWSDAKKPTKLSLLNDLAQAIRPGANWGALKSKAQPGSREDNSRFIPRPPRDAETFSARMFAVDPKENGTSIYELAEDVSPLFSMHHERHPILGLELSVWDGNGACDVSIYTRLVLSKDSGVTVETVHAWEMTPEVAHLVFLTVQNLQWANLYPAYAQSDCGHLCIILGPFYGAAALPASRFRGAGTDMASQGLRLLFDTNDIPSINDMDMCLRLVSSCLPGLELETFPYSEPVQFRISQPRLNVWMPVEFELPKTLDGRNLYRATQKQDWVHGGDFQWKRRVSEYGKLGEALDLALTLVDIDDPNVYLHIVLTPEPKRKTSAKIAPGWRGGMMLGWKVLKLKNGADPKILSLDMETQERLEAGLHGWAKHEGYSVEDEYPKKSVEALIVRDSQRASHHLEDVRALMGSTIE